jgi:tripartite-type tricarboxylate transporter receptor subunit TctC
MKSKRVNEKLRLRAAERRAFNPIPFRGDAETMQQVLGGQVDFGIVTLSSAAGGGHRMLGTFAQTRNSAFPEVPTMAEQGLPVTGSSAMSMGGLFAPAGVPAEVKRKLADACAAAAQGADYARIAKGVHQPDDYFAGSAAFAANVDEAVAVKARLLMALEQAK